MTASKRIFCILLCILMMLAIPAGVSAAEEVTAYSFGDFSYQVLEDGTVCITEYVGEDTNIVIPGEIDGKTVTVLADELFWYNEELLSIELPDTLEYVGARVFQSCTSLTEVKLPDSVAEIGDACFHGCSKLTSVNIPANLVYVGAFAFDETPWITQFDGCTSIILGGEVFYKYLADEDKVVIPDGVLCISDNAFDSKSLSFVSIPDSVAFIGDYSFYNCANLKSIKLPSNIYYLGENSLGVIAGKSDVEPLEDFVIYADKDTIGADYAAKYEIELKATAEFTSPSDLPAAEQCLPTGEIKETQPTVNVGLTQGGVITIVLIIGGCVVVIGGIAVASYIYEKKRKKTNKDNQNNKKKKK